MRSEFRLELWLHTVVTELGVWPGDGARKKFEELNFHGSRAIRENRENYAPRKFGAIRYATFHRCQLVRCVTTYCTRRLEGQTGKSLAMQ